MTKEIRLVKGRELGNRQWKMGVSNPNWTPSWVAVCFPGASPLGGSKMSIKNHVTISDGNLAGAQVYYRAPRHDEKEPPKVVVEKQGEPVPAEELLAGLLAEGSNVRTTGRGASATAQKMHFGRNKKWYIDYDPDLEPLLKKYNLEFETNQTIGEATYDTVMARLQMEGIVPPGQAPGQKAIEEAMRHKESEEIKALKEKIAELEAKETELKKSEKKAKKETVSA